MANLRYLFKNIKCLAYKISHTTHIRYSNIWVFGEWFGDKCCDNSMYFANFIAEEENNLKLYWVAKDTTDTSRLNKKIVRIIKDSEEAKKILLKCGVAIYNQTFDDFSSDQYNYVDGAIIVHLWHGIPWKKIGHDAYGNGSLMSKIYYKIADYVNSASIYISTSPEFDDISISAFGAKRERILHSGYPRNHDFYHASLVKDAKNRIIAEMKSKNPLFDYDNCVIVAYLPTFRDKTQKSYSINSLLENKEFAEFLEKNNIILVQKSHFVNLSNSKNETCRNIGRVLFLNDVNSQDLLCASDILITDYSSVFFDYSILDRPIIHYLYDYDYYKDKDRGLYYTKEEVCAGADVFDEEQLAKAIIENVKTPELYQDRRKMVRDRFLPFESASTCNIIYRKIIDELSKQKFRIE